MEERWFILNSGPGEPAHNMALDKALLQAMSKLNAPVLRFYSWTLPAASFGYFQKIEVVEKLTPLRPLVRRPTGGGIVPHDADWTYSLAFPAGHEWYKTRATESYRRVHAWLQAAFAVLGVETELAPCAFKTGPGQCFAGYEKSDLLWHGRKLALLVCFDTLFAWETREQVKRGAGIIVVLTAMVWRRWTILMQ